MNKAGKLARALPVLFPSKDVKAMDSVACSASNSPFILLPGVLSDSLCQLNLSVTILEISKLL